MEYVILIVALLGIVLGADQLVSGAVSIAKKFKVSDFVIGAAIVGVGTSMPELTVSFIGALQGNSDIAIGNDKQAVFWLFAANIYGMGCIFFPFRMPYCFPVHNLVS